jgi:hypothetical protein
VPVTDAADAPDDLTVAYILAARPEFERLRDVAAQLAGLMVLAAAGGGTAAPDHPMLRSAESLFHESKDGLRQTRATARARLHHAHLTEAADSLQAALTAARDRLGRPLADLDEILTPLRAGYEHLQRAANALPGFQIVAFEHGCCGPSARPALPDLPDRPDLPDLR